MKGKLPRSKGTAPIVPQPLPPRQVEPDRYRTDDYRTDDEADAVRWRLMLADLRRDEGDGDAD